MYKGIIFDFDGVICESVKVKTDAFKELYKTYGSDIQKKIVIHHEANGGISRFEKIKYYHNTFINKRIKEKEILSLANQFSKLVVEKVISSPYIPGALDYIKKCSKKYKLFISTGTPTKEMKQILKSRKIDQYFSGVFGSPDKKNIHIKNIKSRYGISSNNLIFYGDSKADLDAALDEKINFVLIMNSFNKKLRTKYKGKIIKNFIELT